MRKRRRADRPRAARIDGELRAAGRRRVRARRVRAVVEDASRDAALDERDGARASALAIERRAEAEAASSESSGSSTRSTPSPVIRSPRRPAKRARRLARPRARRTRSCASHSSSSATASGSMTTSYVPASSSMGSCASLQMRMARSVSSSRRERAEVAVHAARRSPPRRPRRASRAPTRGTRRPSRRASARTLRSSRRRARRRVVSSMPGADEARGADALAARAARRSTRSSGVALPRLSSSKRGGGVGASPASCGREARESLRPRGRARAARAVARDRLDERAALESGSSRVSATRAPVRHAHDGQRLVELHVLPELAAREARAPALDDASR